LPVGTAADGMIASRISSSRISPPERPPRAKTIPRKRPPTFQSPPNGETAGMSETDKTTQQQHHDEPARASRRGNDDRRSAVKPTDRPVPHSPEPEEDSIREGQEKLERVKPY
jgi:hypothetical protein